MSTHSSDEIPLKLAHIGTVVSDASAVSKGLMAGLGFNWREAEYEQKSEDILELAEKIDEGQAEIEAPVAKKETAQEQKEEEKASTQQPTIFDF